MSSDDLVFTSVAKPRQQYDVITASLRERGLGKNAMIRRHNGDKLDCKRS